VCGGETGPGAADSVESEGPRGIIFKLHSIIYIYIYIYNII
jgi:hypothetical protein